MTSPLSVNAPYGFIGVRALTMFCGLQMTEERNKIRFVCVIILIIVGGFPET